MSDKRPCPGNHLCCNRDEFSRVMFPCSEAKIEAALAIRKRKGEEPASEVPAAELEAKATPAPLPNPNRGRVVLETMQKITNRPWDQMAQAVQDNYNAVVDAVMNQWWRKCMETGQLQPLPYVWEDDPCTKELREERDEALAVLRLVVDSRESAQDLGWYGRPNRPLGKADDILIRDDAESYTAAKALLAKLERKPT